MHLSASQYPFIFYLANDSSSLPYSQHSHKARRFLPALLPQETVAKMAGNSSAKSLADPVLLETIDKLFQHNIGEYVSLPQVRPYHH